MVGDFSTLFSPIDRTSRNKLNRENLESSDIINQMNVTYLKNIPSKHRKDTHSSHQPREMYPYIDPKHNSTNIGKLKLHPILVSFSNGK